MPATQSGIKVIALVQMVGIAALNSRTGQDGGRLDGSASTMLGTISRYDTSRFIPARLLHENGGRLADELKALYNGSQIAIEIDGRRITNIAELMAYSEPTGYERRKSVFLSPLGSGGFSAVSGTWTENYDSGNHVRYNRRTAAAAAHVFLIEIPSEKLTRDGEGGVKLRALDLVYAITTEAADDVALEVYSNAVPEDGTAVAAGTALHTDGEYDSNHDDAAERGAIANHTLTFTFDTDTVDWLSDGESVFVEVTVDDTTGGGAVFDYKGCNVHYVERPGIAADASY